MLPHDAAIEIDAKYRGRHGDLIRGYTEPVARRSSPLSPFGVGQDAADEAAADQGNKGVGEIESRAVSERLRRGFAKRSAGSQSEKELRTAGRQGAHLDVEMWPRNQRILAAPIVDRRERALAGIHRPDGDDR